jgi:hypothetical protein
MIIITVSCKDDETYPESPDLTYVKDIIITVGGLTGDTIIHGKVDEINKEITFPKLHKLTDISKVKFGGTLPEGAQFEYDEYDFTVYDGESQNRQIVSVVNGKRKREYYATIRLSVPVFGAEWSKIKVYDHSGTAKYPDLSAASTRCADMDSIHVLIPSRDTRGLHLLMVSDIKQGNVDSPISLDVTNVSGGTFNVSAGRLAQGHIYVCNLASATQELRLYHWATPNSIPDVLFSQVVSTIPGYVAGRIGDGMSMNLDTNGDGYIFLGVNPNNSGGASNMLKIKITGFTTIAETSFLSMATYGGLWSTYSKVDDIDDEYTYTGYQGPVMLVNTNGSEIYKMDNASVPVQGADTRIISFNQERYLVLISATSGTEATKMYVYNITRGETTQEALELFEAGDKKNIYTFSFGAASTGSAVASLSYVKQEDDKLYLFGAAPGAGFVIFEIPKATEEDNFYDE